MANNLFSQKNKKSRGPPSNLRISISSEESSEEKRKPALKVTTKNASVPYEFSDCGSFKEDDIRIGSKGLKVSSTAKAPEVDDNLSKEDIEISSEILGSGSSCTVKKGIIKEGNKTVALKIMPLNLEENIRRKVLLELRTLYTCNHEAIVKFFGAFCTDGNVTIVLEFMDLGTLSSLIDLLGPMPEAVIGEIAYPLLSAINYMNKELHIVHRDIKPSNILINCKGEAKLSDFGVSGKLENSIAQAVTFAGTVTYMSPERISGKPHTTTSDIWSLGLTLLQCSLGYFPYTPEGSTQKFTFFQLLERILHQPAPQPPDHSSSDFKSFIANCLIKDPNERPNGVQLIEHPFILSHKNSSRNIKGWINKALTKLGRVDELIDLSNLESPRDNDSEKGKRKSKRSRKRSSTSEEIQTDQDKKEKKKKRRDKKKKDKSSKSSPAKEEDTINDNNNNNNNSIHDGNNDK